MVVGHFERRPLSWLRKLQNFLNSLYINIAILIRDVRSASFFSQLQGLIIAFPCLLISYSVFAGNINPIFFNSGCMVKEVHKEFTTNFPAQKSIFGHLGIKGSPEFCACNSASLFYCNSHRKTRLQEGPNYRPQQSTPKANQYYFQGTKLQFILSWLGGSLLGGLVGGLICVGIIRLFIWWKYGN